MTPATLAKIAAWMGPEWCIRHGCIMDLVGSFVRPSDWDRVGAIFDAFVRDGLPPTLTRFGPHYVFSYNIHGYDGPTPLAAALACAEKYLEDRK